MTGGHPRLFARCYSLIEEEMVNGRARSYESLEAWGPVRHELVSGRALLSDDAGMQAMVQDLNNASTPKAGAARELLSRLLTADESFEIPTQDFAAAWLLARMGVLRLSSEAERTTGVHSVAAFQFSSPLMRLLVQQHVLRRGSGAPS